MNEGRVFSNKQVLDKLKKLDVTMIAADITDNFSPQSEAIKRDLERADGRITIPVNLIYPANYPEQPAILLEGLFSPTAVLEALSRVESSTKIAAYRGINGGI